MLFEASAMEVQRRPAPTINTADSERPSADNRFARRHAESVHDRRTPPARSVADGEIDLSSPIRFLERRGAVTPVPNGEDARELGRGR
jgi:hypothetical protein